MDRLCLIVAVFFFGGCFPLIAQNPNSSGNPRDPLSASFSANTTTSDSPFSELQGDARLNDVCFINSQRGWAVGDHGTIWTTADGGINWQLQNTPIDCTLNSVQFLDESFGMAAGHYWFPNGGGRGVILSTHDGGKTWQLRHTPDLPPLYRVKMFNAQTIILAGATSEYCPSGLFISQDSGKSWLPIAAELSDGFVAADFFDMQKGVGIGFHGILQQFQNGIAASQTDSFGNRRISAIKVSKQENESSDTVWAVGDRGLVLSSTDQGYRWGVVPGTLPGNAADIVDLKTIEVHGKNLWVAGNPGTCIYMSSDAGQTWKRTLTGVSAAIRKIVFVSPMNGWAVSDLGTILTTQNGGQTWQVQRTGNTKLAVLGLFGETDSIPFELFADLSADQGFISGTAILFSQANSSYEKENRLHEAMVRIGSSLGTEWNQFSLPPKELWTMSDKLAEHIQQTTDGRGMAQLRERLTATIRQWKPEILITSNYTNPYIDSVADELALREIMEAVKLAADSSAYPHHLTELGLSVWEVKKVYLALKNNTLGDVHIVPAEPTKRFGMPLDEMTFVSRNLVSAEPCPSALGFINTSPEVGKNFFAGITLLPGDAGRRNQSNAYNDFQEEHRRRAMQRRNILGILKNAQSPQESGLIVSNDNLVSQAAAWTQKLEPDSAVQVLLTMAEKFHQDGDWQSASETYLILAQNYARHPLVRQAFLRLMQYAVSQEILAGEHQKNSDVNSAEGQEMLPISDRIDLQRKQSAMLTQFLTQNIPDLADQIAMRFASASALRTQNKEKDTALYYQKRGSLRYDDVWGMRARTEYWLSVEDKSKLPMEQRELPMPGLVCNYTGNKPFLDGKFDSEKDHNVWQRSNVFFLTPKEPRKRLSELLQNRNQQNKRVGTVREERLRQASQNFGTQVMFLYDPEYWYIGLRCPKVPDVVYSKAEGERQRDAVIPEQDRVEILIDIDRDYGTYYSLMIDSSGGVTDMCLGDQDWNPQWHVAQYEDEKAWYIEAAIPMSSLLEKPMRPRSNAVWGLAIRRLVPDRGIECWNAENSFDLTEGFGLLIFP